MGIVKDLQDKLASFLKEEAMSRYAFSKRTGIAESTIKRFLEGSLKNPSSLLLDKIAKGMEGKIVFKKEGK